MKMAQDSVTNTLTSETPARQASRRLLNLTVVALLLFALAVSARVIKARHTPKSDPLHGDMEEAGGALPLLLARTPADKRIPMLLKMADDPNPGLRYAAVDSLSKERGAAVTATLVKAFQDSASVVRIRAMEVLPEVDKEQGLRLLLAGLSDQDTWVREAAVGQFVATVG